MKAISRRIGLLLLFGAINSPAIPAQTVRNPNIYFCLYTAPPTSPSARAYPTYSGVAFSSDRGTTWTTRGWLTNHVNDVDRDPANPATLFLATDYGVLRSTNAGLQWKQITDWRIQQAVRIKVLSNAIWIATPQGPYVSTDAGGSWLARNVGLPPLNGTFISDLAVYSDTLLAATADGLYRSTDAGLYWKAAGLQGTAIQRIARVEHSGVIAVVSDPGGIWISADNGRTWDAKSEGLPTMKLQAVAFDPVKPASLLIGTLDYGVFQSTNSGKTWVNVSSGMTNFNIVSLAFDPVNTETVYAGAENGSFISNDRGKTWIQTTMKQGYVTSIRMF